MTITYNDVLIHSRADTDIAEHLTTLYDITQVFYRPTVVELGLRDGHSTIGLLAAVEAKQGVMYSIDLEDTREHPNFNKEILESNRWNFIQGNDTDVVKRWDIPINHLFIDTSHTYEHTKMELDQWGEFLTRDGVISLHDTNPYDRASKTYGVLQAMKEYLNEHPDLTFFHKRNSHGLGVIIKNNTVIRKKYRGVLSAW